MALSSHRVPETFKKFVSQIGFTENRVRNLVIRKPHCNRWATEVIKLIDMKSNVIC